RAVRAVLEDLMAFASAPLRVADPHAALRVDVQAVREHVRADAPALQHLAGGIELENRRLRSSRAGILEAAVDDVDVAVRAWLGADDGAPLHARGQLRPVRVAAVRV